MVDENINEQNIENVDAEQNETVKNTDTTTQSEDNTGSEDNAGKENLTPEEEMAKKIADYEEKCAKMHNDYLRLYADFENYKKKSIKERSELLQSTRANVVLDFIPLADDLERAMASIRTATDVDAVKEGVDMIYNKFIKFLSDHNVKAIETEGQEFNTDFHEAIATIPAGDEMKNKIVDCTQKGYTMDDKVIRFAKVVIGQ